MFEIWDGDLYVTTVEYWREADWYAERGYRIVDLSA
jgi:hypothetical protein